MAQRMVHCSVLGQTEISADGIRLTPEAERQFGMALYYCANAGREVPRDDVAALFWPEQDLEGARHCLRQALYRLRAVGVPVRSGAKATVLDQRLVDADFMPVIAEGAPPGAFLALSGVAVLPGYAPGFSAAFGAWVEEFRGDVGARLRRGLVRALADARARGRYVEVDRLARHCLTLDPLNEEATLALAEAVALAGGKAEALRMIERYQEEIGGRRELCVSARILKSRVSDLMVEWGTSLPRVPLIGREQELELLLAAFREAGRRRATVVRFWGDPGVGKTSIVDEFTRIAGLQNASIARVLCHSSERDRPFSALCEIVGQLQSLPGALGADPQSLRDLQPLVSYRSEADRNDGVKGRSDRRRLLLATSDLVDAVGEERPVVVVLDDAQWADHETLRLFGAIASSSAARRLLVIACHRGQGPLEVDGLPLLDSTRAETREIRPLAVAASRQLLESLLVSAEVALGEDRLIDLLKLSGGSPLFMVEVARRLREHPFESVPSNLNALIEKRIHSRSPVARTVLQACVVLGKHASIERLERVLQLPAFELTGALNELESYGLIAMDQGRVKCGHELVADVVNAGLLQSAATFLRNRAAAALASDASATGDPSLLWQSAQFLETTHHIAEARSTLEQLSDYLLGIGSAKEAGSALERALKYCDDDDQRIRLLGKLLRADRLAGNWQRILETVGRRSELAPHARIAVNLDSDVLLRFEAKLRQDGNQRELLTQILTELHGAQLNAEPRFALLRMGLILADNTLQPDVAHEVIATMANVDKSQLVDSREGLTACMIFHSTFGELKRAAEFARLMHETAPPLRSADIHEFQRLRWTFTPFLYLGDFDEAEDLLVRIYHAAEQRRLQMEAFEGCDSMVVLNLRRDNIDGAKEWHGLAAKWMDMNDAHNLAAYAANTASIAIWEGKADDASGFLSQASLYTNVRRGTRSRLRVLGLQLAVEVLRGTAAPVQELSRELLSLLSKAWNFGDNDLAACALAKSLELIGANDARAKMIQEYSAARRELYPLPSGLAAFMRPGEVATIPELYERR